MEYAFRDASDRPFGWVETLQRLMARKPRRQPAPLRLPAPDSCPTPAR